MISQKSNDQLIDFESQYIAITFSVSNCTITLHKLLKEKVCKSKPILYKDTAFLVPTSNILERFFSAAKFAFNDHRQQNITCKPGRTAFSEVEQSILG